MKKRGSESEAIIIRKRAKSNTICNILGIRTVGESNAATLRLLAEIKTLDGGSPIEALKLLNQAEEEVLLDGLALRENIGGKQKLQ